MFLILVLTYYVSLSTLVLNSRDRHEKYDLLKKMCLENNLTTTFSSTCYHTIYWYDAISTINSFKQLKTCSRIKVVEFHLTH